MGCRFESPLLSPLWTSAFLPAKLERTLRNQPREMGTWSPGVQNTGSLGFSFIFKIKIRELPGCLVVNILNFHCHGPGSVPGRGTDPASQAMWPKKS